MYMRRDQCVLASSLVRVSRAFTGFQGFGWEARESLLGLTDLCLLSLHVQPSASQPGPMQARLP